jgi:hypothetical protein
MSQSENPDEIYRCRVCGYRNSEPPWGPDCQTPSHRICPCCGTEFGYEDITLKAIRMKRGKWVESGMPWFSPKKKPKDWNAEEQMQRIPSEFE